MSGGGVKLSGMYRHENMRILLIEDDPILGEAVRDHLAGEGMAVDWMTRAGDAETSCRTVKYDLILLDLNLPDGSGLDLLRTLRSGGNTAAVIILTALDQISDRIRGLNSGADDYLVKPFDLDELSARLAAVKRRYEGRPQPILHMDGLIIDQINRLARVQGRDVALTAREWAVLDQLLKYPGAVVSKDRLEDALYAFGAEVESNTIEVYISRLRKKIGRQRIHTVRGVGYRLET